MIMVVRGESAGGQLHPESQNETHVQTGRPVYIPIYRLGDQSRQMSEIPGQG